VSEQLPDGYRFRIGWTSAPLDPRRHRYVELQQRWWRFWFTVDRRIGFEAGDLALFKSIMWREHQADQQWTERTETTL
jgi:hypothetical protein